MSNSKFYEKWSAATDVNSVQRRTAMFRNAELLSGVFDKTLKISSIVEIGGAEGHVINRFAELNAPDAKLYNYEISRRFCEEGKQINPKIRFFNAEFSEASGEYDLCILSDIVEHIQDDAGFLKLTAAKCRFLAAKIPIENCLYDHALELAGKRTPIGKEHPSGPLHEYDTTAAMKLLDENWRVRKTDRVNVFELGEKPFLSRIANCFGPLQMPVFGGALFAFAENRRN